jgi:hypothetical protein
MIILPTSVPDEVVEAAVKRYYEAAQGIGYKGAMRAGLAAALNAWPDAGIEEYVNGDRGIFLPLPQEPQ